MIDGPDIGGLPFTGLQTFLGWGLESNLSGLGPNTLVAVGAPYDEGTPYAPGSRFGPAAIRAASMRLRFASSDGLLFTDAGARRHVQLGERGIDAGDATIFPRDQEATFARIEQSVSTVTRSGAIPIVLGGDNSITYPTVKGLEQPPTILQFDAHLDYGSGYFTRRHGNSTPMRQLMREGFARRIVHCGIRGLDNALEDLEATEADGNIVITSEEVRSGEAVARINEAAVSGAVYVSLDVDVFDPSVAPGTGYPEPGGITLPMLRPIFRQIARTAEIIGCEVVEVSPGLDINAITSLTAAQAIVELLMSRASSRLTEEQ